SCNEPSNVYKDSRISEQTFSYTSQSKGDNSPRMMTPIIDTFDDDSDCTMMIPRHPLFHRESRVPSVCCDRDRQTPSPS
ncbi:hypothetical protein HMI56_005642, partial [Coelomomyces lativittatus]